MADPELLPSEMDPAEPRRTATDEETREILSLVLEHSNDAIYILAGTRFPFINRKFQELFSVGPEEADARDFNVIDLVAPVSRDFLLERARMIADGETVPSTYEFCALSRDGREIEVEASTKRIKFRGKDATLGVLRDITERKKQERKLLESEELLRTVISNTPIVLWAIDRDGIFTLSQGRGLKALGLKPGEVVGSSVFQMHRDNQGVLENIRRVLAGESFRGVNRIGELTFETYYAPLWDGNGEPAGAIGVSADITEQQALEAQLRQATKMEAIGRLAGGIAHDFNNILTVITGNAELGLLSLEDDHPLRERLESIQKASAHAHDLTSRLLAFSRKQVSSPRVLDLNEVLRNLEPMLQRIIGENNALECRFCTGAATVRVDPGQLEQVLVNLVVNAYDAMPGGGTITVETSILNFGEAYRRQHPYIVPGLHIRLSVTDTGVGMSEEIQAQVFEPFYTTKSRGTGLGLSTVYGIVKQAGASIELRSEEGAGTTVEIYFPRADEEPEPLRESRGHPALPVGSEQILLVEDEDAVRDLAAEILTGLGYTVSAFADPVEAESYFDREDVEVDLLLTDVVMPNISGADLVRRLLPKRPELKVLYMSGYTDDAIAHHGVLDEGVRLLNKPFTSAELARMVRDTLEEAPRA